MISSLTGAGFEFFWSVCAALEFNDVEVSEEFEEGCLSGMLSLVFVLVVDTSEGVNVKLLSRKRDSFLLYHLCALLFPAEFQDRELMLLSY